MSGRTANEPVLPALLVFGGIAVVVAMMARVLFGQGSPLRSHAATTGASSGHLGTWALILSVGLPALVALGIIAWLWTQRGR